MVWSGPAEVFGYKRLGEPYHSLTIVLVLSGVAWAVAFARMDPNGKTGQVIGNIVSEWTQVLTRACILSSTPDSDPERMVP